MKIRLGILFLSLVFSFTIKADEPTADAAASSALKDVAYNFDQTKIKAAQDSFHFLRSFVDLYYLVYRANRDQFSPIKSIDSTSGWCVGDAHAENFGFLIQNNQNTMFTMNDMDDSGPCPLVLDLFRLMVSSRLYDSDIDLKQMIHFYKQGLDGNSVDMPKPLVDMQTESTDKGESVSAKRVENNKIVRDPQMTEVSPTTKAEILKAIEIFKKDLSPDHQLIDIVETSKVGGGSGGLVRYELLLSDAGNLLYLELKQEVKPSIYPVATAPIPSTADRITKTISVEQSPDHSVWYSVLNVQNINMMTRPRFDGDVGVSLDKQSKSDNIDIINYEAYTLGKIHTHSLKDPIAWKAQIDTLSDDDWKKSVNKMADYFDSKYKSLNK